MAYCCNCLSVCVSVFCVLGILVSCAQMAELIVMPFVGPRNHALDGVDILLYERAIFGVVLPIEKHWQSVLQCVQQNRSFSPHQLQTAPLLQPTAVVPTGRYHFTLSPVKKPAPAMRPFVRLLRPLVW